MRRCALILLMLAVLAGCGGGSAAGTPVATIPPTRVESSCDPVELQEWMDEIQPLIDEVNLLVSDAFADRAIDPTLKEHQDRMLIARRSLTSVYPPCAEAQTYHVELLAKWDEYNNALRFEGSDNHERALSSLDRAETILTARCDKALDVLEAIIRQSQE
jgi:hypothetical protein